MGSMEENIAPTTTIFDLPLKDLLIPLAKGLKIQDIFSVRCCSRYFKELGDEMLEDLKELVLIDPKNSCCFSLILKGFRRNDPEYRCNEMTIHVIIQKCHKLRKITLDWDTVASLTDEKLAELLSNNPHLEEVNLTSTRNITSKALSPLATGCKKLVKLSIEAIDADLRDDGFLEMLSERNNQLLEIHFFLFWSHLEIPINTFEEFFKKQPHLQRISLSFHRSFPIILLSTIAEACKDLNYLGFSDLRALLGNGLYGFEDALRKLVESCPKLHTLKFLGARYVKVTHEFRQFLQLKNIRVGGSELDT